MSSRLSSSLKRISLCLLICRRGMKSSESCKRNLNTLNVRLRVSACNSKNKVRSISSSASKWRCKMSNTTGNRIYTSKVYPRVGTKPVKNQTILS